MFNINQPIYRAVPAGFPPLKPSLSPSRAFWAGTAGIYCASNYETAAQEFKKHHPTKNMEMYKIENTKFISS